MAFMNVCILTKSGEGYGYGHIRRSNVLSDFLNKHGIKTSVVDLTSADVGEVDADIIITDAREFESLKIKELLTLGKPIISFDDTQTYKPYLVSIMSLPYINIPDPLPNYEGSNFLVIDPSIENFKSQELEHDLLITFGGEDPNELTKLVVSEIMKLGQILPLKTCILIGKLFKNKDLVTSMAQNLGICVIEPNDPSDVFVRISKSKIVVTSFGITVYESLILGKKVILLNNSDYHESLFRRSGLEGVVSSLGVYREFDVMKFLKTIDEFLVSNGTREIPIDPNNNLAKIKGIVELVYRNWDVIKYSCLLKHDVVCVYRDGSCSKFFCRNCNNEFIFPLSGK
jgi:spore coat polysaccharide biosynthesis predicted glycosyltransferase SpsG